MRTHSDLSSSISIDDSDVDDDVTLLQSSQQSTESASSSWSCPCLVSSPSSHPTRKMTAAMRKERDGLTAVAVTSSACPSAVSADVRCTPRPHRINAFFHRSSSSTLAVDDAVDDDYDSDGDTLSSSQLLPCSSQPSQSTPPSSQLTPVVGCQLTDITNVVVHTLAVCKRSSSSGSTSAQRLAFDRQRSYFRLVRARHAHPDDNTMCAYCGEHEHPALHHKFKRAVTGVLSVRGKMVHADARAS